jgi:hypothetical protein
MALIVAVNISGGKWTLRQWLCWSIVGVGFATPVGVGGGGGGLLQFWKSCIRLWATNQAVPQLG